MSIAQNKKIFNDYDSIARERMIIQLKKIIDYFPCNKTVMHGMITDLKTVNSNSTFELKVKDEYPEEFFPILDESSDSKIVIKGLETGLDVEKFFPIHNQLVDIGYKNIHYCSVYFDNEQNISQIVFSLISFSRKVSFEVEFDSDFQFKWYTMYYFNPDKMLGDCNDSIISLREEMSYLSC